MAADAFVSLKCRKAQTYDSSEGKEDVCWMLDKVVREVKWWGETFYGLAKVIASPNAPIPPTDIHPRQPAIPSTPAEGFRSFPFRWWWKLCPFNRNIVLWMSILIPIYIAKFPPEIWKAMLVHQIPEHMSLHKRRGKAQRIQDELYFAKYDPMKEETPIGVRK
ncbi:unnamed protein product [Onchocerca ochengi]|uniref:Uncharacterized protein n=1 Tax=Onchocerca ochengi TaxID=42157 RepID=A0A182DZ67_ONCOC|nr:unnamed protein product [Onchocerca ochengi]